MSSALATSMVPSPEASSQNAAFQNTDPERLRYAVARRLTTIRAVSTPYESKRDSQVSANKIL